MSITIGICKNGFRVQIEDTAFTVPEIKLDTRCPVNTFFIGPTNMTIHPKALKRLIKEKNYEA